MTYRAITSLAPMYRAVCTARDIFPCSHARLRVHDFLVRCFFSLRVFFPSADSPERRGRSDGGRKPYHDIPPVNWAISRSKSARSTWKKLRTSGRRPISGRKEPLH